MRSRVKNQWRSSTDFPVSYHTFTPRDKCKRIFETGLCLWEDVETPKSLISSVWYIHLYLCGHHFQYVSATCVSLIDSGTCNGVLPFSLHEHLPTPTSTMRRHYNQERSVRNRHTRNRHTCHQLHVTIHTTSKRPIGRALMISPPTTPPRNTQWYHETSVTHLHERHASYQEPYERQPAVPLLVCWGVLL